MNSIMKTCAKCDQIRLRGHAPFTAGFCAMTGSVVPQFRQKDGVIRFTHVPTTCPKSCIEVEHQSRRQHDGVYSEGMRINELKKA